MVHQRTKVSTIPTTDHHPTTIRLKTLSTSHHASVALSTTRISRRAPTHCRSGNMSGSLARSAPRRKSSTKCLLDKTGHWWVDIVCVAFAGCQSKTQSHLVTQLLVRFLVQPRCNSPSGLRNLCTIGCRLAIVDIASSDGASYNAKAFLAAVLPASASAIPMPHKTPGS